MYAYCMPHICPLQALRDQRGLETRVTDGCGPLCEPGSFTGAVLLTAQSSL